MQSSYSRSIVFACCFRLFDAALTKPVTADIEMADSETTGTRKWSADQEKLFLDLLIKPEVKRIGGDGNGVMDRKEEARWAPLLARFLAANESLVASAAADGAKRVKIAFDGDPARPEAKSSSSGNLLHARLQCSAARHQHSLKHPCDGSDEGCGHLPSVPRHPKTHYRQH
jgi:hypothetical protein